MILGIDLGNENIKTSEGVIFKAKTTDKEVFLNKGNIICVGGETYVLGEGDFKTDLNKTSKENMLPLLLGAIALSTTDAINSIVLGLPIQHFKANKDKLKEFVMANRISEIIFNDKKRKIVITDISIFPEGLGAYYYMGHKEDCILIDLGGRTTNIILIENGKVAKYQTLFTGMLNIYDNLVGAINSKYTLNLELEDGEKILANGLKINGVEQDLAFVKPILKLQIDKIFKELNINFPVATEQIFLSGGGSSTLEKLFKKKLNNVTVIEDALFANAKGFKKVGVEKWG